MEDKKLHCLKCGGEMIIGQHSIGNCQDCDNLSPLPQGIFSLDAKNSTWIIERYNKAIEYNMTYQFHRAYNIYDKMAKSSPNGYAYWGKVLSQYGVVHNLDINLTNKMILLRTQYESVFDNDNYLTALELLDSQAQALIKNEAASIEKLRQENLNHLIKSKPHDVLIIAGNNQADKAIASTIIDQLDELKIDYFYLPTLFDAKNLENLEKELFPQIELSPTMIVIDEINNNNPLFKNAWIRFLTNKEETGGEFKTLIGIGKAEVFTQENKFCHYYRELSDNIVDEIVELIDNARTNIDDLQDDLQPDTKLVIDKLIKGQFNEAKDASISLTSKNEKNYQSWWAAFLTKYKVSNNEEMTNIPLDCSVDLFFQKAFYYAPTYIKRKYANINHASLKRLNEGLSSDVDYDNKLKEAQVHKYIEFKKNLWRPFLFLWGVCLIALATLSLKSLMSFLITLIIFAFSILYVIVEVIRIHRLGKTPSIITSDEEREKYYVQIRASLTPTQSAIFLPNPLFSKLRRRVGIFIVISIGLMSVFFMREIFIGVKNWNLNYRYEFSKVIITGGRGEQIVIPEKIGGRVVVRISDDAFSGNKEIKSVFFKEGTTIIGSSAFADCPSLQMIYLPSTLKKVGDEAPFRGCSPNVRIYKPTEKPHISALLGRDYYELYPGLEIISDN